MFLEPPAQRGQNDISVIRYLSFLDMTVYMLSVAYSSNETVRRCVYNTVTFSFCL